MSEDLDIAVEAARTAGRKILEIYKKGAAVLEHKRDQSPITNADIVSHETLIRHFKRHSPYPVLSEEGMPDVQMLNKGRVWMIDPLDGTKSFIEGREEFSVMVALLENGRPIAGVVHDPWTGTLFYGSQNQGSYRMTKERQIKRCLMKADLPLIALMSRHHNTEADNAIFNKLKVKRGIFLSSIGLKAGSMIMNNASLYCNCDGLNIWDIAAPYIIVREAGGEVYDRQGSDIFEGRDVPIRFTNGIFMSHRHLMPIVLQCLL